MSSRVALPIRTRLGALSVVYCAVVPAENINPIAGKRIAALARGARRRRDRRKRLGVRPLDAGASGGREHARQGRAAVRLPEQFNLDGLQSCCEQLLGRRLDKCSFRWRLLDRRQLAGPHLPAAGGLNVSSGDVRNLDGNMGVDGMSFCAAIGDWLGSLGLALRAAVSTPLQSDAADPGESVDPAADSSRRYGHSSPGYLTRNGLGSLEIGAADD